LKKFIMLLLLPFIFFLQTDYTSASSTAERVDGKDRFQVAANLSKKGWPDGADSIILSFYNAYADALAAGPLAYLHNAPILLTQTDIITPVTKEEIVRLNPDRVIIVGGPGSVSENVFKELNTMGIKDVTRITGNDRFEVAANIAKVLPSNDKAIIADGLNFPDALAISPYASRNGIPILLTKSNGLPQPILDSMIARGVTQTIVVGGEASVSKEVFSKLKNPKRIAGKDRYEVAVNVAIEFNLSTTQAYLATGMSFADALTGSVLAAKDNAPMLLTRSTALPDYTRNFIKQNGYSNYLILGGLGSVEQRVVGQLSGPLAGLTIVVDPGHGGVDPGATGSGMEEKQIVLDIGDSLKRKLELGGSQIVMTRTDNSTYVPLDNRVEMANKVGANTFISIHLNSYTTSSPNGTETYWNSQHASQDSKELAIEIQKELINKLGTNDRGVKEAGFRVIKDTTMASVLIEVAFISNTSDAKQLAKPEFRDMAAEAIYQGVINFYSKN
jgi:N-acetylmuramoyl-L-alanine amidase